MCPIGANRPVNRIHAEDGGLRERMAKLEGLPAGLREAITGRKAAAWRPYHPSPATWR